MDDKQNRRNTSIDIPYKNLLQLDPAVASKAADVMICAFCVPLWIILIIF